METRLLVVPGTPSGAVRTIRDGAIRARSRIRSGALPGLAGLLAL